MHFLNNKWVSLVVVVCFALLQLLQPFIHAHLDAEHPIQNTGFHVGDAHEDMAYHAGELPPDASSAHDDMLSDLSHASHTVTVASGMTKQASLSVASNITFIFLLGYIIALALQFTLVSPSNYHFFPHKLLKRRLPASRAPPQA